MKVKVFTAFLLAALCAGRAGAMPPEAAALFKKAGVELADADLYRIAEIYNFWEQKGDSIWPGMYIATTPVQIIFPEKLNVLIGHPDPPADCVREAVVLPGFNKAFCHRPDRKFLHGASTSREGGDLAVSVNTLGVFDDYVNGLIQKQRPGAEKYTKPYLHYLGELAHELTHAYQNYEARRLPARARSGSIKSTKIDYPYQDPEVCLLLGLEGRILSAIMDEEGPEELKEFWRDFLAVRARRRELLPGDLPAAERFMELSEGTAQYVGWSVQYGKNDDVRPSPQLAADPRFEGYSSSDTLRGVLKQWLAALELPGQSRWMLYVYTTGTALAYNLDKASPGWKAGLFSRVSGLKTGLDDLVTASVPRSGKDSDRLAAVYARYDAGAMRARIAAALEADLADSKAKLEKFYGAPGKRHRLRFCGADPRELLVMGPVMLTEAGSLRVWEAGANKAGYKLGEKKERAVVFSRALPLLHDREAGFLEIALPADAAPRIKAGRVRQKNGVTSYRGGVEYENGVFSWKGARLDVSEKDGVVTLLF